MTSLSSPPAGEKISYGSVAQQFGELRLPEGAGPFPVVVVIHGGCWLADFNYLHIRPLAAAMTREGFATWTIEFRRLGDFGGGWPGTFQDVGAAIDKLPALKTKGNLDLQHVILLGHSSGGHLALWAAGRAGLPVSDPLFTSGSLAVSAVIGLAPIVDLAAYRIGPAQSCHGSVDRLIGGTPEEFPARFAAASPAQRLPLGVPQWIIQGTEDPIVTKVLARTYVAAARQAGDVVNLAEVPGAGHFDDVIPGSPTWPALVNALHDAAIVAVKIIPAPRPTEPRRD